MTNGEMFKEIFGFECDDKICLVHDDIAYSDAVKCDQIMCESCKYYNWLGQEYTGRRKLQKKAMWIHENDDSCDWYVCSNCGHGSEGEVHFIPDERTCFCPHCGAEMEF